MATFDANDMLNRLKFLFGGKQWTGNYYNQASGQVNAWNNGQDGNPVGQCYGLFHPIAQALSNFMLSTWPYVKLQTRLATSTDTYVDLAWNDFYRGRIGRNVGESDSASTSRLRQTIITPTGVHGTSSPEVNGVYGCGVLGAVQAYISQNPSQPIVSGLLAADVFDLQTDPVRSSIYGITYGQFAVILYYPVLSSGDGWFLDQSFLGPSASGGGDNTFLSGNTKIYKSISISGLPAIFQGIAQLVSTVKDCGYFPVYIQSVNPVGS